MQISGGEKKGHKLKTRKLGGVRPLTSKIRSPLFSILGQESFENKKVLDLFAGTGIFGLECLSRGVAKVCFVDRNPYCIKLIKENLEKLGFPGKGEVLGFSYKRALDYLQKQEKVFDLVFVDPPYNSNYAEEVLVSEFLPEIMEAGGVLVMRTFWKYKLLPAYSFLKLVREERYGEAKLFFYRKQFSH